MSGRVVLSGGTVVTMDGARHEYADGYVVVEDGRVSSVGSGAAPDVEGARVVDARGCVVTPGLVNTHHHLYQWVTRGLAVDSTLFEWLT
ncbi:MAG TPA: 8-oxoguanine deaminase, partial [Lapillicoccus sp.]|nr:8-oxoguanine deaminase [Lapillicoccus sp.]